MIMHIILIFLSLFICFLFMNMNHPLAMGLILLFQTFLICLISGTFSKTFWFSYILFLIFLGGMLVLFIYITSLASNEMFSFSMKLMMTFSLFFLLTIMISIFIDKMIISSFLSNLEMNYYNKFNFIEENTLMMIKLYNFPTNMITLMIINYLFLTLIIIVKITKNFYGPLRNYN